MTFLHWPVLLALSAVAAPILIHLLNRRSAQRIDWGAMQFLLGSLVSRRRRVLLDEILLLACRCLLIALVVTALARPVIPAGSSIAWAVILPIVLVGAVAFGVGTAFWRQRRWRWICFATGAGLLALAGAAVALEHVLHLGRIIGPSRDVAVVIDGSASMTIEVDGQTNFHRAVEEARSLVHALKGSATVSIVLAGPVAEVKTPVPLTDTAQLEAVLDDLKPVGGLLSLHDALRTSALVLATANNATKQIVLLTDRHKAGWELDDADRWTSTAQELHAVQGIEPRVFCRMFDVPDRPRNLAVTELAATRRIIGTDRATPFRARVVNTGQTPVVPCAAYLVVDGKQVDRRAVGQLEPGASETLTFSHRFEKPGSHVIEVKTDLADDLLDDNHRLLAVHVLDRLPVLLVNGRPGPPAEQATAFVQLALDPKILSRTAKPGEKADVLVEVTTMDVGRLGEIGELDKFRVVVLADATDVPGPQAVRLSEYAVRGGSLLIAVGRDASLKFYNGWTATVGEEPRPLLPGTLRTWKAGGDEGFHPSTASLTHPALQPLRDARQVDLQTARLAGAWDLDVAHGALIAGKLSDESPWLVEHSVGLGRVLLTASALDLRDGNLPTRQSFVPLVHGLIYHLAAEAAWDLNRQPGRAVRIQLPASLAAGPVPAQQGNPPAQDAPPPPAVEATAPDGAAVEATAGRDKRALTVELAQASMPGEYRLRLSDPTGATQETVPLTIAFDPAESELQWLSTGDLEKTEKYLDLQQLGSEDELRSIAAGQAHGVELWKSLVFLAFLAAVGEMVLVWWISLQRIPDEGQKIDFSTRIMTTSFREELDKLQAADEGGDETVIDLLEAEG